MLEHAEENLEQARGRILGRNWEQKSKEFSSLLFSHL